MIYYVTNFFVLLVSARGHLSGLGARAPRRSARHRPDRCGRSYEEQLTRTGSSRPRLPDHGAAHGRPSVLADPRPPQRGRHAARRLGERAGDAGFMGSGHRQHRELPPRQTVEPRQLRPGSPSRRHREGAQAPVAIQERRLDCFVARLLAMTVSSGPWLVRVGY